MLWTLPDAPVVDLVPTNFYMNYNPEVAESGTLLLTLGYDPDDPDYWDVKYKHPDYQGNRIHSAGTVGEDIGFILRNLTLQQDPGNYTCAHNISGESPLWGIVMFLFIFGQYNLCGVWQTGTE